MASTPLAGKVCIVTGATRGIGKGIALQLAEKGAKVYITGRTLDSPKGSKVGGSLRDTAQEIEARGGICVPVQCDHSKDNDIERLFEQVKRENEGQLDILVNNAYSAVNSIFSSMNLKFWEQPSSMWDDVNNVGLRNHYICAVYAARIMVPRKQGLIVNVSSAGGLRYLFNVAYGIGKEACDRMAADCGSMLFAFRPYKCCRSFKRTVWILMRLRGCAGSSPGSMLVAIALRMASTPLAGKVCIVTGATRGIGKGIALQLAEKGAKVYITGRTLDSPKGSKVGGSLRDTAQEIEARGGICVPVQCDHSKDNDIERLFEQVKRENEGQLDILVNNAYSAVNSIFSSMNLKFWEQPSSMWDDVNNVGLRNHYICAVYAARIMVPRKQGLIVNVSSAGGLRYLFNVAYGIGKEACDRMAADCGFELKKQNVAFVSLWPGAVGTERVLSKLKDNIQEPKIKVDSNLPKSLRQPEKMLEYFEKGETTEFAGQCIAALATDPELMKMSGKIVQTCDLARRYGLEDAEGHGPSDYRQINVVLRQFGHPWLAYCVPNFVRIPKWVVALAGNKFF